MKYTMISLLGLTLLAGCSSSYTASTSVDDWYQYGYTKAMSGAEPAEKNTISQQDADQFANGYQAGLGEFCQQDGYQHGLQGRNYHGQCDEINEVFAQRYSVGVHDRMSQARQQERLRSNQNTNSVRPRS
ncbi:DUF2799 domain-containing protein [Vibrio sp. WXL210]|uniref:DUF2799 domain-containing protein n=1 Tax=Vibrio sp. WXL210 TaxID=3450709 RepID=UPI003EC79EAD